MNQRLNVLAKLVRQKLGVEGKMWDRRFFGMGPHGVSFSFENGYTADFSDTGYGNHGLLEGAVIYGDELVYDTPITNDVVPGLVEEDALEMAVKVSKLPPR